MTNTTKNHYVPQGYLVKFFNELNNIYRYDKSSKETIVFSSTKTIGFENNLYTLKGKISPLDKIRFEHIIPIKLGEEDKNIINLLVKFLNDDMASLIKIKCEDKEIENFIEVYNKSVLDNHADISKTQELLCTMYERAFYNARDMILKEESLSPLYPISDEFKNPKFFIYLNLNKLAMQHMLNKLKESIIKTVYSKLNDEEIKKIKLLKPRTNYRFVPYYDLFFYAIFQIFRTPEIIKIPYRGMSSPEKMAFLMLQFDTIRHLADWHADGMKPILIINDTKIPFITSDRPSINLYGKLVKDVRVVDGAFELYFPISNKFAILWSERECYKFTDKININSQNDVKRFNRQIFDNANTYVFSSYENIETII